MGNLKFEELAMNLSPGGDENEIDGGNGSGGSGNGGGIDDPGK